MRSVAQRKPPEGASEMSDDTTTAEDRSHLEKVRACLPWLMRYQNEERQKIYKNSIRTAILETGCSEEEAETHLSIWLESLSEAEDKLIAEKAKIK